MQYSTVIPIEPCLSTAWMITHTDGTQSLELWDKTAVIEDVLMVEWRQPGDKVMRVDVGQFPLKEGSHYYSGDARSVDTNMEVHI